MSDFKAKMHQINFDWAPHETRLGELIVLSPRSWNKGDLLLKEMEERGRDGSGKEGEREGVLVLN